MFKVGKLTLGSYILGKRIEAGYTSDRAFALDCGLGTKTINSFCSGQRRINMTTLEAMMRTLGISEITLRLDEQINKSENE